jgi:hypothetical protein
MADETLWDSLETPERVDDEFHDILADMSEALHDTVSAPEVAAEFESTPEQLLEAIDGTRILDIEPVLARSRDA